MDSVELVMETEDEFVISIDDEEAAATKTVGELFELVSRKLTERGGSPADVCRSARRFYTVRRKLAAHGIPRRLIKPKATMGELFRRPRLAKQPYEVIRSEFGHRAPPIRMTTLGRVVVASLLVAMLTASVGAAWCTRPVLGELPALLAFWGTLIGGLVLTVVVADRLRHVVPEPVLELGEMIRSYEREIEVLDEGITRGEVFAKIRTIVSEQLGVDREKVMWDSRFVEDLGMG